MVDEGKRVMTYHTTLTSMWHAMSSKLTPQDAISCYIKIHMSCNVGSFHMSSKVDDGPTVESISLTMCYKWFPREMSNSRWVDG
jgi:hypothetical protein